MGWRPLQEQQVSLRVSALFLSAKADTTATNYFVPTLPLIPSGYFYLRKTNDYMTTLTDIREKQAKCVVAARAALDSITNTTTASRAAELNDEHDRALLEYDGLEFRARELGDDRRPTGEDRHAHGDGRVDPTEEQRKKAFNAYLRYGDGMPGDLKRHLMRNTEQRAFGGEGTGGADFGYGQYLIPQGFMAELVKSLKAWGPMLDPGVTRMLETNSGNTLPWPTMNDTANVGSLIGENTQVDLAEIDFGSLNLGAFKYTSGVVLVSSELLQDSGIDVEPIVRDAMGERVARIGNTHLTTGTGSGQPQGIVTGAGAGVTAGSATALVFDDLIELYHSVDPAYRLAPTCKFMFNDSTLKVLRKLKDGDGRYIWQPANVATSQPATLLDTPYVINQAVASIGSGNKSVVFGDFRKYVVRMVRGWSIKRLVERYADTDQTGFIGFSRLDGRLLDSAAVKRLVHP